MNYNDLNPGGQPIVKDVANSSVDPRVVIKSRRWVTQLVLVLVIVSSIFRFTNLDGRFYWHDESMTSIRTAGQNPELIRSQLDNRLVEFQDLQKFQHRDPTSNVGEMVNLLAVQDAKHPPFYFMLVWAWRQIFGDSITAIRLFSAVISLLIFPALYWLGLELFANTTIATMMMGVVAFSPIHLLFAQEARAYSLWTVLIIASSAALLRAMKQRTRLNWLVYIVLATMGVYTQTLFTLVLLGHGIYVGGLSWHTSESKRWGIPRIALTYLGSLSLIGAIFSPWLYQIVKTLETLQGNTAWAFSSVSKGFLVKKWLITYSATFVDWDGWILAKPNSLINYAPKGIVVLVLIAAFYFLCRNTQKRIWLLLVALIAPFIGGLMLPDLILGGQRSIASRYFLGVFIALQIAIAYLFSVKIFAHNAKRPNLWKSGLMLMLVLQIISCNSIIHSQVWWTKFYNLVSVANIINRVENTLVISDTQLGANLGSLIALSNQIKPGVKLQLVNSSNPPLLPLGFKQVLLVSTANPDRLLLAYEDAYTMDLLPKSDGLVWQMTPKTTEN
ncbi:glycosyltransferase family 39 protein [filamentous cyanobacterium LEGE 11480]|uniref:Glycosyltransferase family 39 protein n=1 Tax=Romeriopsis navalis LEGE 11480 TaxID=2777977 RepID=A0A928Z4H3_9CYAN|nr:glycosyltransferase family 39 protein [Romeriopsis navalis]MBE9030318.1 glycosyltransferase family 39 protein [Romeriopsis navalis LEGE 11480]